MQQDATRCNKCNKMQQDAARRSMPLLHVMLLRMMSLQQGRREQGRDSETRWTPSAPARIIVMSYRRVFSCYPVGAHYHNIISARIIIISYRRVFSHYPVGAYSRISICYGLTYCHVPSLPPPSPPPRVPCRGNMCIGRRRRTGPPAA